MIQRTLSEKLSSLARRFLLVTVTGPRQSGKTTPCRMVFPVMGALPYGGGLLQGGMELRQQGLFRVCPAKDIDESLTELDYAGFEF